MNVEAPSPAVDSRRVADSESPAAFDLGRQEASSDRLRKITADFEVFTRTLASDLSTYLGVQVTSRVLQIEQSTFAAFAQHSSTPKCLVALSVQPQRIPMLVEVGLSVVFPALELLLGGPSQPAVPIE